MKLPSDSKLTEDGLAPAGRGELLLIACGALAREILALIERNGWRHMALTCLPAILHNRPETIPDAVEAAVKKHRDAFERIYVVYADCGTGGLLQARCKALGVEMVPGPHCYSFFEGNAAFAAHDDEITAFYLTDFLVRQFDAFVTRPLKFDKHPELKEMYFGHYEKLVYQAQTDDPALTELARQHAETLGLAFERRFTGYGDLEVALAKA
ncbi:DUF1638 domain-containing protein [Vannielia litorea]|uniref:DUF1638 domain-containing protein n=1 Tax=Vannielia litorea TaxID=1217970 RepID=A0A1N6FDR6_9RHOB|nr:DUF1638 domain-containing protein [Vannielia litorea]SIN93443.1 Protein of unknown function [Vannielia litorea]